MRTRTLFLPPIDDIEVFRDLLTRSSLYLAHAKPEDISFIIDPSIRSDVEAVLAAGDMPADFDPRAVEAVERLRDSVALHDAAAADRQRLSTHADVILVWDTAAFEASAWVVERSRRARHIGWYDVDRNTNGGESIDWALLGERMAGGSIPAQARRLREFLDSLPPSPQVVLFGESTSIDATDDVDVSRGVRIVGAPVVLDDGLMDRIAPHVVACDDPVMDFGPSRYAGAFRDALRQRLAAHPDLVVVVPQRHREFLVGQMPEADRQVIGIPVLPAADRRILDLRSEHAVAPAPDVSTLLMVPIAATIGSSIELIGFHGGEHDGAGPLPRRVSDSMPDLPATIERLHPRIDDEYSAADIDAAVESMIQAAEALGIEVRSHTPSVVPALDRRRAADGQPRPEWTSTGVNAEGPGLLVVSVDPDWVDDFGHYGPWFRSLAGDLASLGIPSVSLASRAVREGPGVLPTFTHPTTNPDAARMYASTFGDELASAIRRLRELHPDRDLVLAFYTADTYHLPPIARVAAEHDGAIRGAVNLMRAHRTIGDMAAQTGDEAAAWSRAVASLTSRLRSLGIRVTADTAEQAGVFADVTGVELPIWPMTSAAPVALREAAERTDDVIVYCPSQSQVAKGILEFADAAIGLIADGPPVPARFKMRSVQQPSGTHRSVVDATRRAAAAGVEILDGALDDTSYARAIEEADLVVVPYRADVFRTRTSSVALEAALAGKPIVVASGTWGAREARNGGAAVEFRSGDAADLRRAIAEALVRIDALTARSRASAGDFADRFAMRNVAEFIIAEPAGSASGVGAADLDLEDAETMLGAAAAGRRLGREQAENRVHGLHRREMDDAAKLAEQSASNELLQRAIAYRDRRIDDLESAIADRRRDITERDERIAQLADEVHRLSREIENVEQARASADGELTASRELAAAQEVEIEELRRQMADRDDEMAELRKRPVNRVISAVGRRFRRS